MSVFYTSILLGTNCIQLGVSRFGIGLRLDELVFLPALGFFDYLNCNYGIWAVSYWG